MKAQSSPALWRQIHVDFHTPPQVTVGDRFKVKAYFDTMAAARVNSFAFFAKCHHGYSYFNTKIGTRHPGLSFDLLGKIAAEAVKRKMSLLAYFSLNVDEVIAEQHPEWVALNRDGSPVNSQVLQDGSELYWRWLCPNRGPYLEEFFFPHLEECMAKYPMDGIFIDMAGYLPGSCFCPNCLKKMKKLGLDPDRTSDHARFNSMTMDTFARELRRRMDRHQPGMRLNIGCYCAFGEAAKAKGVTSEFYIESLSYQTGWFYFPIMGRYLSNTEVPIMGITGRFLKNWGDFGTVVSPHQLKVQLAEHLSVGATSCIGDHLPCSGHLEPAVYDVIGEAYRFIEPRQPYCCGMERTREATVLVPGGVESAAAVATRKNCIDLFDSLYGTAKVFMEGHYLWDVMDTKMPWERTPLTITLTAPETAADLERFRTFVTAGGTLFVDPAALLPGTKLEKAWWQLLGLKSAVPSAHPGAYYRVTDAILAKKLPDMAHYVHAPSVELTGVKGTEILAQAWYPPFTRSREHFYGHFHGPDSIPGGPAILRRTLGKGRIVVFGQPLFAAHLQTGYHVHRQLLFNLLDQALPQRLVTTDAPLQVEITVGEKDQATVIQLIPFFSDRRHRYSFESLNERITIHNIAITLRTPQKVKKVWDPISGQTLPFQAGRGTITFTVPEVTDPVLLLAE